MINKVPNHFYIEKGRPQQQYEITVKDIEKGEILYQHDGFGGLLCTVEKIISFSKGEIEGQHQCIGWGNPLMEWYAFERLQEFLGENTDAFIDALEDTGVIIPDYYKERLKKMLRKDIRGGRK